METQLQISIQQITFQNLNSPQNIANSAYIIQNYIKGHTWHDSFNCITELRKIIKYHPELTPDILQKLSQTILQLLNTGKPILVKNILRLLRQIFNRGQQVNVQKAVIVFLAVLIKKAATDIGNMKTAAQQVLNSFYMNCGYEISLKITIQGCMDKNGSIAQLSMQLFSNLLQKVGSNFTLLCEENVLLIIRNLSSLINGNRQSLVKQSIDMCILIYHSIGCQNYIKLMQYSLDEQQMNTMSMKMQSHGIGKQKQIGLKQAINNRKTDKFNQNFFNSNKMNQNFIPLTQKNMNYQTINVRYQLYNDTNYYNQSQINKYNEEKQY